MSYSVAGLLADPARSSSSILKLSEQMLVGRERKEGCRLESQAIKAGKKESILR